MDKELLNILGYAIIFLVGIYVGTFIKIPVPTSKHVYSNITIGNFTIFPTVAITSNGKGVLEYGILRAVPGNGRVYIGINPFVEPDTQYSIETAKDYICKLLNADCSKYNFIVDIKSNATLVGGPSAGLAFAIAFYCLLHGKNVSNEIAATGTIDINGNIGPIGGVFEKALAAAKHNKKIFFLPKGQSIIYTYEKVEKKKEVYPGFYIIEVDYIPKEVNLTKIFWEKYRLKIVEVSNFKDVLKYNICE